MKSKNITFLNYLLFSFLLTITFSIKGQQLQLQKMSANLQTQPSSVIAKTQKNTLPVTLSANNTTQEPCATYEINKKYLEDKGLLQDRIAEEANMQQIIADWRQNNAQNKAAAAGPMPIIFHVVLNTAEENVTDAQITAIFNEINEDFQLQNTDASNARSAYGFVPANPSFSFCLAQRDPNGNQLTTPGINRVATSVSQFLSSNEPEMKQTSMGGVDAWDNTKYINVWIVDMTTQDLSYFPGGTAGYAYLASTTSIPTTQPGSSVVIDGVVLDHQAGMTVGGHVLTHELGHFFGLNHTWESSGGVGDCTDDDGFTDTPNTNGPSANSSGSCSGNQSLCTGIQTQYENYMDYSSCTVMFTDAQQVYMNAVVASNSGRKSLTTSNGCTPVFNLDMELTGVSAPVGSFCSPDVTPVVTIRNQGGTTITSATILYSVDGATAQSYSWTGSLATGVSEIVTMPPAITPTVGAHTFSTTITSPNGSLDENASNDVATSSFTKISGNTLTISVITDQYGSESGWQLKNSTGTIMASVAAGSFSDQAAAGAYQQTDTAVCLADGCYDFIMTDVFGDGMNAGYGAGSYTVTDDLSIVVASGGNFSSGAANTEARDSTRFCVPSTPTLPVADFVASAVSVPVGATVTFTDLSTGAPAPTSWSWSFESGTPATSIAQNPQITYNTVGTYSVTLTATNTSGSDSKTKVAYIDVYTPVGGTCDTITNLLAGELPTSYGLQATWGYLPGHNGYNFERYADKQNIAFPSTLQKIDVAILSADAGSGTSSVDFVVWGDNVGLPGAVLATETRLLSSLTVGSYNTIIFSTPPSINGDYYVGYQLNLNVGDTLVGALVPARPNGPATIYHYVTGAWTESNTAFGGNLASSLAIYSYFSTGFATAAITTNTNLICEGDSVFFDGSNSTNTLNYYWDVDGNGTLDVAGDSIWVPYTGGGDVYPELFVVGGCGIDSMTTTITINNVVTSLSVTSPSCGATATDGSITATSTGAGATYTYLWSTGGNTATISNVGAGTYYLTTTDNNGCFTIDTAVVSVPSSMTFSVTSTDVSAAGANDGVAGAIVSGGTSPYTFSWNNSATSQTIANLNGSIYCVTVYDAGGCNETGCVTVTEPNAPLGVNTVVDNPESCGQADGQATATAYGGVTPYSYIWGANAGNVSTPTISGLSAGVYSVSVIDGNSAVAAATVTITNNVGTLAAILSASPETCGNGAGSASSIATGGTNPYTYLWNNNSTATSISGLSGGTYYLSVTDNSGCLLVENVVVANDPGTLTTSSSTTMDCGSGTGSASTVATGGTAPYGYSWSATNQNTATITGLAGGSYNVTVSDAGNCQFVSTVSVTSVSGPTGATFTTSFVGCTGDAGGEAIATPTDGTAPYTYIWSNGSLTNTSSGLASGFHLLTITDANGCEAYSTVGITDPTVIVATATSTNENCGLADGTATTTVSGGITPYTYTWSGNNQNTATTSGLASGSYTVSITDDGGCVTTNTVSITNITTMATSTTTVDALCSSSCDGTASITGTGGSLPYTYLWSNNQATGTATGLCAGTYSVVITDASGCAITESVVVSEPNLLQLSYTKNDETCGDSNGSITLAAAGGTANYTYLWEDGTSMATKQSLTAGNYGATVTDGNGCQSTTSIVVSDVGSFNATITAPTSICQGGSTVLSVAGGASYTWSTGETTPFIQVTAGGVYICVVSNANCSQQLATTVTLNQVPVVNVVASKDTVCPNESVVLTASGADTYLWSPTGSNNASVTVNPTVSQSIFSVIGYNGNCSSTPVSTQVPFFNPIPTANASADITTTSPGFSINFSSTGSVGDAYSWDFDGNSVEDASTPSASYSYSANGNYAAVLTMSLAGSVCTVTDTVYITIDGGVGINQINENDRIVLFPNPTSGTLVLDMEFEQLEDVVITVYNTIGAVVILEQLTAISAINHSIDLSNYRDGLYYVNIKSSKSNVTKKITLMK